jgi:hypothetical protein
VFFFFFFASLQPNNKILNLLLFQDRSHRTTTR